MLFHKCKLELCIIQQHQTLALQQHLCHSESDLCLTWIAYGQCTGRMLMGPDRMPKAESKGYRMSSKTLNRDHFSWEWRRMASRMVVHLVCLSQWYVAFEHLQR